MNILLEGLQVTVIGMGVVFLVLFALILVLRLFERFLYDEKNTKEVQPIKTKGNKKIQENDELNEVVAAITAVFADSLDNNESIVNIRQLN